MLLFYSHSFYIQYGFAPVEAGPIESGIRKCAPLRLSPARGGTVMLSEGQAASTAGRSTTGIYARGEAAPENSPSTGKAHIEGTAEATLAAAEDVDTTAVTAACCCRCSWM